MLGKLFEKVRKSRLGNTLFRGRVKDMHEIFHKVYATNYWGSSTSRSGTGSDLIQTAELRERLPEVICRFGIQTVLDIPCGDFNWMKEVDLKGFGVDYIGADIVSELIKRNQKAYGQEGRRFEPLNLVSDPLPKVDLVFCRDGLVHFSHQDVFAALRNIKRSRSTYLLTTTFTNRSENADIATGDWRPLNLQRPPFNLGMPLEVINEMCTEGDGSWGDKSLGLWRVSDI